MMSKLTGKKILVTGGAGFIGSHLVDALIKKGCYVRVIDNLVNGKLENLKQHKNNDHFKFILGSITDAVALSKSMKDIDIIFHLACLGVRHSINHPFENHRVNAEGTLKILQKTLKIGVKKFIYCSSSEVYGNAEYVPMDEKHPTRPRTVYGASKLAAEAYVRAFHETYGLNTVIVRPFNTYGPRSHHGGDAGELIPKSILRIINEKPILIFGDGLQTRDYTYVEDIVEGLIKVAYCDELIGQTFNIGSEFEISVNKIAEMILKMTGASSQKLKYLKNRPGDVVRLYADSTMFKKKTGWQAKVSFADGLFRTIQWVKSRPGHSSTLLSQEIGINW